MCLWTLESSERLGPRPWIQRPKVSHFSVPKTPACSIVQGPSWPPSLPAPCPLLLSSIYAGSPFYYPHHTHQLGRSLRSGVGQGGDFSSLGATHGAATQCDGASGQPHSSATFPPEPLEGEREVLWCEEQTHTPPRNLLASQLVVAVEQTLGPGRVATPSPSLTIPPPPALIRTSCGWGLCCAWCWVGEGRQRGWREKSETNGSVVGAEDWQSAHHGLGSALLRWGIWENGPVETLGVGGQGLWAFILTPACSVLPGQRWHPGVSGVACWSGSSRTVGTNGAQDRTARRTTSPLGPPTVSAH